MVPRRAMADSAPHDNEHSEQTEHTAAPIRVLRDLRRLFRALGGSALVPSAVMRSGRYRRPAGGLGAGGVCGAGAGSALGGSGGLGSSIGKGSSLSGAIESRPTR